MAYNGTGLFQRLYSWANDAVGGILIRADRMDAEMDGFASGLSNAITRDGQGKPTATIDWNTQNLTNVGTVTAVSFVGTTPTVPPGTNDLRLVNAAALSAAITANTAGVSTFNTRSGAVTLNQSDVTNVGGALSSSLTSYLPLTGGTVTGLLASTSDRITIANSGLAMSELHIPTFVAWGMFLTNSSTSLRFGQTGGGGNVISEKMRIGLAGDLWTSQIGDLATALNTKADNAATQSSINGKSSIGSQVVHASAVAEFGAVNLGSDNVIDCAYPYVMVGLRGYAGATGSVVIRGILLKTT
jgi:hypothetical protein